MDSDLSMLYKAMESYESLESDKLMIESKLPGFYHNDYHFKIRVKEQRYSARFLSNDRYDHNIFLKLTDQVLEEQMKYIDFLIENDIPFMRLIKTSKLSNFATVNWKGKVYRFFLFEWMEGKHITHCTESISYKFGLFARKFHDISLHYNAPLPKESHSIGSKKIVSILKDLISTASDESKILLHNYLILANWHVARAYSSNLHFIMQSDLNPLNILWDDTEENIIGIVDFEHIGYTDRIESLAWLIKWYSRTDGLTSHNVSSRLTESLLLGYGAQSILSEEEFARLPSLLWITGCLNWGFVNKTMNVLKNGDPNELEAHLALFRERGMKLSSLVPSKMQDINLNN